MLIGLGLMAPMAVTVLAFAFVGGLPSIRPASEPSRGELLYTTHCIACHGTEMHRRDPRLATDWDSLKEQVRLWQERAQLPWTENDVVEVTHFLNRRIYRFGLPTAQASLRP